MSVVYLLLVLASSFSLAALALDPVKIPDPVDLDRDYNVAGKPMLTPGEKTVVRVHTYDLPMELVGKENVVKSTYLDDTTRDLVLQNKKGKTYVRVYIAETVNQLDGEPEIDFASFDKAFHEYKTPLILEGRKLVSHSTYRVTDPKNPNFPKIDIKMQRSDGYNWGGAIRMAVTNNDIMETSLRDRDRDRKLVSVLPERIGVSVEAKDITFANLIRLHQPLDVETGEHVKLLPTHGLVGHPDLVKRLAERRGLTVDQWYEREFLPKLARFHANLNLRHGIYSEGHSQNTLTRIDAMTGEVVGFVFRDLQDAMPAPTHRVLQGKKPNEQDASGNRSVSELYHRHVEFDRLAPPGANLGFYTRQTVDAPYENPDESKEEETRQVKSVARRRFLEAYLKEAEAIAGGPLTLNEATKEFIKQGEFAYAVQGITEAFVALRLKGLTGEKLKPVADRQAAAEIFRARLRQYRHAALASDTTTEVERLLGYEDTAFTTDGERIYLMDKTKIVSFVAIPTEEETKKANGGNARPITALPTPPQKWEKTPSLIDPLYPGRGRPRRGARECGEIYLTW